MGTRWLQKRLVVPNGTKSLHKQREALLCGSCKLTPAAHNDETASILQVCFISNVGRQQIVLPKKKNEHFNYKSSYFKAIFVSDCFNTICIRFTMTLFN